MYLRNSVGDISIKTRPFSKVVGDLQGFGIKGHKLNHWVLVPHVFKEEHVYIYINIYIYII